MNPTWSDTHWSSHSWLTQRHLLAFLISLVLLWLLLLIPIHLVPLSDDFGPSIEVTLSQLSVDESANNDIQLNPQTPSLNKPQDSPIKSDESLNRTETEILIQQPARSPEVTLPSEPQKTQPTPPLNRASPSTEKVLPSAGVILNSLDQRSSLTVLDEDFLPADDNRPDFVMPSLKRKEAEKLLTLDSPLKKDLAVNEFVPMPMRAVRGAVGFLFMPIEDKERTSDHMNYCSTLGRYSHHCPVSNPTNN